MRTIFFPLIPFAAAAGLVFVAASCKSTSSTTPTADGSTPPGIDGGGSSGFVPVPSNVDCSKIENCYHLACYDDPNCQALPDPGNCPVGQVKEINPDGGEGALLTPGVVNLTAMIIDKDGDFQTASLDLGSRLTLTDDGPTIGAFSHATVVAKDGQVVDGTFDLSFGADGEGAMRVAVHNGTVNGYNLRQRIWAAASRRST